MTRLPGYAYRGPDPDGYLSAAQVAAMLADYAGASAAAVPAGITCLTPAGYRNPGQLPPGGVLVVGASASGVQLADELARSGRPVTLAVGEHVRMPRTYRGGGSPAWTPSTWWSRQASSSPAGC